MLIDIWNVWSGYSSKFGLLGKMMRTSSGKFCYWHHSHVQIWEVIGSYIVTLRESFLSLGEFACLSISSMGTLIGCKQDTMGSEGTCQSFWWLIRAGITDWQLEVNHKACFSLQETCWILEWHSSLWAKLEKQNKILAGGKPATNHNESLPQSIFTATIWMGS